MARRIVTFAPPATRVWRRAIDHGRIGLISCGKTKLEHPAPARELYCGEYFRLCRDWIERPYACLYEYGILSAKHGLVMPDDVLEPYELALSDLTSKQRGSWGEMVCGQIISKWTTDRVFVILAGEHYRHQVKQRLPFVNDKIAEWTLHRKYRGMAKPQMGIGVLKKELMKELGR